MVAPNAVFEHRRFERCVNTAVGGTARFRAAAMHEILVSDITKNPFLTMSTIFP